MLCIQETKKKHLDNYICHALWGDTNVKWEMQPAINRAWGLCLWNESSFRLDKKICGQGFIYLEGIWIPGGQKMSIVNTYAPCDMIQKRNLWDQIKQLRDLNPWVLWCILGDFNNIRTAEERIGLSQRRVNDTNMDDFNEWMDRGPSSWRCALCGEKIHLVQAKWNNKEKIWQISCLCWMIS